MINNEKIIEIVFAAIDDFNQETNNRYELQKSLDSYLFGNNSNLDSLGLVNLIVCCEQHIQDRTGKAITIADSKALSRKHSPFRTVATLVEYIGELLATA